MKSTLFALLLTGALAVSGCGGTNTTAATAPPAAAVAQLAPGDAAAGATLFEASCAACHGPKARGLKGLGKDLVGGEFVKKLSDAELLDFINTGRPASDPLNTTGQAMLPKGGNPALNDQDITNIIAWLRTQKEK